MPHHTLVAWLRTDRSGDCWLWVALHTVSGACQRWWWWFHWKLSRVFSRIREIFIETLIKNFTEFFNVKKIPEILHYSLLVRILERSNFTYGPLPFVDQLKCTFVRKKTWPLNFKSLMSKNTHFTYLISISRYFVNIVSISYRYWKTIYTSKQR